MNLTWHSQQRKKEGENPLNIVAFWETRTPEPPVYWEEWIIKFHWGMIAKYDIDPDDFYFASTLNTAAITALPEEVNGKNRLDSEKKLKSNLYLCIGDEAQRIFKARKPTVNIKPKPTVGGEKSCFDTAKSVSSNENERKDEYANIHREHERSIEGVFTCNRRLTNQRRDICIPAEICKYQRTRFRLCSYCLNYSCKHKKLIKYYRNPSSSTNYNSKPSTLKIYSCKPPIVQDYSEEPLTLKNSNSKDYSEKPFNLKNYSSKTLIRNNWSNPIYKNMSNSPEKNDPPTSAIVNTSTNLGNVNLNVVLNRLNQPPSVSSDSDIKMIPPEKLDNKQTNSKKLKTIISFPHQFPGLSYPLVQNEKWIYSIVK